MDSDKPTILIVEDDDVAIAFYTVVLQENKIGSLKICQDSRDVMPLLAEQHVSAILLDLNMPHLKGQELLKQVKVKHLEIPVIVITGVESVEVAVECMKIGAFDFLSKPVEKNRLVTVVRHAIRQRNIFEALLDSQESYLALSEITTDAILQINEGFKIEFANAAVRSIFEHKREELLNQHFKVLFPEAEYKRFVPALQAFFLVDKVMQERSSLENTMEIIGRTKQGEIIPLEISFGKSKSLRRPIVTCIIREITQRKNTERKLEYLAYHDKLTQLGNRDLFNRSLSGYLAEAIRYENRIGALLFLDLDGFKKVNDTLGHDIGDRILVECSRRLRDCLRKSDHIYRFKDESTRTTSADEDLFRFGGDEFVLILTNLRTPTAAATVARKIIQAVGQPYSVEGSESITKINLGVSVGIAVIPDDGIDATILVSSADVAMYKAKEQGNQFAFFTKDMNTRAAERLMLEDGLRQAFGKRELSLYYQPLVNQEGTILGAEALLRWQDESGSFISPARFIPVAEETGLIEPMGEWTMNTACDFLHTCNGNGHPDFYISVNLSAKQFDQQQLVERITATAKRTCVNPSNIILEVTESCIMGDPESAIAKMHSIKENNLGIRIAIDDFGTGYSSLGYLSKFPVDILKIDQSFIANLSDENNIKIVDTIIALAHSLNLKTVAEGVATEDHLELLSSKNCDAFQGYYFGAPVPAEEMCRLLEQHTLPL